MTARPGSPGPPRIGAEVAGSLVDRLTSLRLPHWAPVLVVLLGGLGLTWLVAGLARDTETERLHQEFADHAEDRLDRLEREIRIHLDAVEQVADLFRASEEVSRRTFRIFATSILDRYPGFQALEWVPRVPLAERERWVAEGREDFPEFDFLDRDASGELISAPEREEYFPIFYVEPYAGNERALGFDPSDLPTRSETIERAIRTERLAVSEPMRLVQGRTEPAIAVFSPVFRGGDPAVGNRGELLGLAEAVFWVDQMVRQAFVSSPSLGVRLQISDTTGPTPSRLYPIDEEPVVELAEDPYHEESRVLDVAGRRWKVTALATPGRFRHAPKLWPVLAGTGALLTLVLASFLGVLLQRERTVRELVEERTRELAYQAAHDSLTGLINRGEFDHRLAEALRNCRTEGEEHVLLYIDLDQFKVVNDTSGHAAGDELLRQLGKALRQTVREADVLARLGGDEFGVLLSGCRSGTEGAPVDKILETIQATRLQWSGRVFAIGASVGVVHLDRYTESAGVALSQADAACYIAKERGRNRYHVFRDEDTASGVFRRQLEWVAELRDAVESDRLELLSQPILPCALEESQPFHELLLVLRRENGRTATAAEFVPAAERYGLMPLIDRWVVEASLRLLQDDLHPDALWSINVSGQSLGDERFTAFVEGAIRASGVEPGKICFEITETAVVADLPVAQSFIHRLRRLGCRFALDDFGAGMSSFQYLRQLPVDFVKIDGSFVRNAAEDDRDRAVVSAIHELARVHQVHTIAESVEDKATFGILREVGVHYAQGFYLGRPVAADSPFDHLPRPSEVSSLDETRS